MESRCESRLYGKNMVSGLNFCGFRSRLRFDRVNLFISRSALQMDLVLTVFYYCGIMVHWSEAKPR
uniref:Uncharacterized protein n=1 Tax=Candidatus Kentrum sp. SD TaxID=2126332 RepID=A0A450Z720_9GAMM|nr:MAG: hypothetical protein BECKSD772F_GA0070984_11944 [Candidatus Kentron sp. SD]VFK49601.1 MAG: hypothetical protein BECKSD772E_GA0070983_11984 [Candidatus Kentron sp. SD]